MMNLTGGTITASEIAKLTGRAKTTILRMSEKERWPNSNSGNRVKMFIVSKLPEDIQVQVQVQAQSSKLKVESTAVPVGSPDLSDWQNKIALARADLIRAYLGEKRRAKSKKERVTRAAALYIKGYNTGQLLPRVYEIVGKVSRQSVDRRVKAFRDANYDYTVLAPQWGNRRGQRKVTDVEFNALLSFGLHPNRLRLSEITRLTKVKLKKTGLDSPSSDDTLRRALDDWIKTHHDQWILCREGEKALNDKCLPYLERDAGLLDVGEVLVADGHTLNFNILHPFTGKPCRMTLIVWYDWASCMPVGREIMPTENVQCVASSLRRAILALGKMPRVAYMDNGKAFKARVFTDRDIDFEESGFYGMFARLGIETIFAWPYNAQSKPVERFFGTFTELERLMPTYTGASIDDKPAHMMRNEKLHRRIHEQKYGGWMPTIAEASQIITGWVDEYAGRPHRGIKGLQPGEVFLSGKGPGVDEKALRFLMMNMDVKRVDRNGIRFMGRNYYDEALYGLRDRVTVRYDFDDLSKLFVYDRTGAKFICEAAAIKPVHPVARISGTNEDLQLVREGIRQKRALKRRTESTARAYVEEAPVLVAIPDRAQGAESIARSAEHIEHSAERKGGHTPPRGTLPRGEAERIEAEAAKMTVIDLTPKSPDPIYMTEPDRYEALLEMECHGAELSLDDMQFMRYFETTSLYRQLRERMEFLRELFVAGDATSSGSSG